MPWQSDGNFLRTNNQFTGTEVWEKDQQAAIKIIASRHDYHDEDLATGIEQCLNVNGYNKMLADIDMNGFAVTNQANISQGTFVPTLYSQGAGIVSGQLFWHRTGYLVTVFGRISWTTKPTEAVNHFQIAGLPYDIPNNSEQLGNGFLARVESIAWGDLDSLTTTGDASPPAPNNNLSALGLQGMINTDRIGLYDSFSHFSANENAGNSAILQYGSLLDNGYLEIQFTYATEDPF